MGGLAWRQARKAALRLATAWVEDSERRARLVTRLAEEAKMESIQCQIK